MFNMSDDMLYKQLQAGSVPSDSNTPIEGGNSFLDPVIDGGNKILSDDQETFLLRSMLFEAR